MTLALLLTAVGGAWAQDTYTVTFKANGNTKTVENVTLPYTFKCDFNTEEGELDLIIHELYGLSGGCCGDDAPTSSGSENVTCGSDGLSQFITISAPFEGTATVTGIYGDSNRQGFYYSLEITCPAEPADPNAIKVTTNAAEEGATFTEATFAMPAFDATAEYELVRDMSVQMTAKVGNAADGADYRIRIKKDNQTGKFVPAEMNPQAMAGLITVTDDIEEKTLTNVTDYTVSIFAVDGDNNPTGNAIAFADLVPGRYVAIATAADGSAYDGATEQSNVFVLFQGYEIEVPAGEFATFYKEEALGLGEEHYTAGAALYTITDVNGTTATATELEITTDEPPLAQVAPAYTPLLVYNGSDEDMRVLLIPTTSSATVSHFSGFTGSLESQTLWGGEGFYACNGKQFVYVKNDLTLPANKCCLKITSGNSFEQGSRSITIVFDDATGISHEAYKSYETYDWYDLNGRKLNGMPTKKGVYILNGKKVVVK